MRVLILQFFSLAKLQILIACKRFRSYGMCEEKTKKKERKKESQKNKMEIFIFDFPDCKKNKWNSGGIFPIIIAKVFFTFKSFASLCCSYLRAAPIPYIQDTILNLLNSYLRTTTIPVLVFVHSISWYILWNSNFVHFKVR